ncbi:hypothetical protein Pfo_002785 [Paulownia fortunei]|nr:hypothetical protein Pfo_002785 [Paulownia fortunei]
MKSRRGDKNVEGLLAGEIWLNPGIMLEIRKLDVRRAVSADTSQSKETLVSELIAGYQDFLFDRAEDKLFVSEFHIERYRTLIG